jgi:plastocyanin
MRRLATALAVCAIAPFGLVACGGDDEESSDSGSTGTATGANPTADTLDVAAVADGSFAFEQDSLETDADRIAVNFDNPAPIAHDFCLEDEGGDELGCTNLIADGDTDVAEYELEPGEYTYFCSVAGHREGGMEGTLTVE